MIHKLKTIQPYFNRCWEQSKTFEIRLNDRDFQKGDTIVLQEYEKISDVQGRYLGREIYGTITYVLQNYPALQEGYVAFSFSADEYIDLTKK